MQSRIDERPDRPESFTARILMLLRERRRAPVRVVKKLRPIADVVAQAREGAEA